MTEFSSEFIESIQHIHPANEEEYRNCPEYFGGSILRASYITFTLTNLQWKLGNTIYFCVW